MSGSTAADEPQGNRSVSRALHILELLARSERELSLADISRELAIPKSSTFSLLRALAARNFVATDHEGRYGVGLRSFEVGGAYLKRLTPVRAAESELRAITESLNITTHFAVLEGDDVVYLAKHDPPHGFIRLASSLGARLPAAITAVGLAQLAHHEPPVDAPRPDFEPVLDRVRLLGYAVDSGETAPGIRCVAAPVFSASGCCGAIGVSYLQHGEPDLTVAAAAVVEAARRTSLRLGAAVNAGQP